MKREDKKVKGSSGRGLMGAIAAAGLAGVLGWVAFHKTAPLPTHRPDAPGSAAVATPETGDEAAAEASTAPALPGRRWKVGDSFVYDIESSRRVALGVAVSGAPVSGERVSGEPVSGEPVTTE